MSADVRAEPDASSTTASEPRRTSDPTVIVAGARTGMGRLLGSLKDFSATDLGGFAITGALEKAGVAPEQVDYVIMGQVLQAGAGQMPARQSATNAGIPMDVPSITINKVCLSGLDAIALADQLIRVGEFEIVVAGGQESMSSAPHLLMKSREGFKYGDVPLRDHMAYDGLWDVFTDQAMGALTDSENTVNTDLHFSREEQDAFALRSHQRAVAATENGTFKREIVSVPLPNGSKMEIDEGPRRDTTLERLASLEPAFLKGGTVTAGNSSPLNDGAAAIVLMSAEKARELGIKPLAKVHTMAVTGVRPDIMGIGPVPAVKKALQRAGMQLSDIDLIELNEAFAAQSLAVVRDLGIDEERLNVHGGAIALGHPQGCSGSRIVVTLLNALQMHDKTMGLATLCVGGGQGVATIIERMA